jgi:hypothetical protein
VTQSRSDYEAEVRRPGKFEGEAPWVPYFWDALLDGMADEDDGEVAWFTVTDEDRELFPELAGVERVGICEDGSGLVYGRTSP